VSVTWVNRTYRSTAKCWISNSYVTLGTDVTMRKCPTTPQLAIHVLCTYPAMPFLSVLIRDRVMHPNSKHLS